MICIEKRVFSEGIEDLEAEWERLLQQSSRPSIFSTYDYIHTSCTHFDESEELFFLLMRAADSGELLAIFPLSRWTEKKYRIRVRVVSHGVLPEGSEIDKPYPIIHREHESVCWERFARYFKHEFKAWDVIDLDEIFAESHLVGQVGSLFATPGYHTKCKAGPDSPIVELKGDWEEFWGAHRKLRKKTRRLERQIGERLRYEILHEPDQIEECLSSYIELEKVSWKRGEMVAANAPFYADLLPKLAVRNQVWFGMLYDEDRVISIEVAYAYLDRIYFCHGTYDPEFAQWSPGAVNSCWFIRFFSGRNFVEGDYLAGFADYVSPWAYRHQKTFEVVIRRMAPRNLYLATAYVFWRIKRRLKSLSNSKSNLVH